MKEAQDLFDIVQEQLEEWPNQSLEGSSWMEECSLRERLESNSNAFGGTCFLNRSLLKRKQDRSLRKSREGRYSNSRPDQPEFNALTLKCCNIPKMCDQLKRLQKGLIYQKPKPSNPRYSRQKKLIKRIERSNKQNDQPDTPLDISSLQLQQYRQQNEQLSEVFIKLYRFYQKQIEQNEELERSTFDLEMQLASEERELQQRREELERLRSKIDQQREEEKLQERELFMRLRQLHM